VLPRWFGRDAVQEAQAYQREIEQAGAHALPSTADALAPSEAEMTEVRVFQVENAELAGTQLGELRRRYPQVAVERVRHAGQTLEPSDSLRLEVGDTVVLSGPPIAMVRAGRRVGTEVADPALGAVGLETVEVVAIGARAIGQTVGSLLRSAGHGFTLNAVFRGGEEIPFGQDTVVQKGDVFRLTGSALRIRQLEALVEGPVVRPSVATDIVTLAVGLAVGALLGSLPIPLFGLKLSLGSAVGLLVTGIVISILRTRNPTLGGPFPEPARQLLEDLGLNVFIAITALNVGAGVLLAVKAGALMPIVVGTLVVGFIPPVLGWALGQYRFKLNAGLLTGAVAGARCSSPGLRTAQEDTRSTVPAISYPVTFAVSNVLVTLACYLMASLD
jgi:putative transport protein